MLIQTHSLIGLTLVSGVKSPIGERTVFGISRRGGERMPKIIFRGKTYYSEFEMPPNVRQSYRKEKRKERAVNNVEEKPASSRPLEELPKTEDIYRQSAPSEGIGMRGLIWGVIVALIITAIAFVISRLIL